MSELSIKIDEMLETSRQMINSDFAKGFYILNEALDLAEDHNYIKGIAWGTLRKGSYVLRKEDKPLAISYYFKALKFMNEIKDYQGICRCHYSLATTFAIMTQYEYALNHFLKALEHAETHDQSYFSKILNNLSNVYRYLNQYDEAILVSEKVLTYMKEHDEMRLFMPYTSLGQAYLEYGAYDEALACADKALKYLDLKDEGSYRASANMVVAGSYKGLEHYDEALIVYNRALKILDKVSDQHNRPYIHREIADLYLMKKEYNYAFKHVQMAMTEAIKQHNTLEESEILLIYAKLYEALENYKKAYESYKRANQIIDNHRSDQLQERYQGLIMELPEIVAVKETKAEKKIKTNALKYTLNELKSGYSFIKKVEKGALTDAFVEAVVDTIDLRDTTTSGHSKRLADYTTSMMKSMNDDMVDYPEVHFTEEEIKVMYYASLLHDIGKLSVPENILLKSRRISEESMQQISLQTNYCIYILKNKLKHDHITKAENKLLDLLSDDLVFLSEMATAQEVSDSDRKRIKDIFSYEIIDEEGVSHNIIDHMTYDHLITERGNLTPAEWQIMKNHASNTIKFLSKIPWLEGLEMVPELAGGHHEKLDGSGYPHGLTEDEITLAMRILGIVDIFEALTAKDRPYKKTYSVAEAMEILKEEAKAYKLDIKLVNFFEKHKICYLYFDEDE